MQSPECGSGKSPLVSVTPLIPCPGKDILPSKDTDFIHQRWTLWTHELTYPEWRRRGVLGLPADDVTPVVSSSSSTATVVSMGSPENTWLDHRYRIRLRMVSRRTSKVKVEKNRLDQEDNDIRTLGHILP